MKSIISKDNANLSKKSIYSCLAESLEINGNHYLQLVKFERRKINEESVHEIRVTIRKLEACLELLEILGIQQKKLTEELLLIRKIHGPLRNIHVELDSIKGIEKRIKSKQFKIYLKQQKKKLEKKTLKTLDQIHLNKQHNQIKKVIEKLLQQDNPTKNKKALSDMELQNQTLFKKLEKTKKDYSPNVPKSIHAIRITAKRLRYQSEILKPVINFDNINLRHLKHFQDVFGKIQNNYILQKKIEKFLHKKPKKVNQSVLALQSCIAKDKKTLLLRAGKMKGMNFLKVKE